MRSGATTPPAERFRTAARLLAATRPTAVNLFAALERMDRAFARVAERSPEAIEQALTAEADDIAAEDIAACLRIGRYGQELLTGRRAVLTHCNAGALATAGYGTALGVIRGAVEAGKPIRVLACETRPFLQGARLTAWELSRDAIPVELMTDSMAGHFLSRGEIEAVVVGADRIASNGDVANKIGTYSLAVLAPRKRRPVLRGGADHDDRPRLPRRFRDPDRGAAVRRGSVVRRPVDRARRRLRAPRRLRRHAGALRHGNRHRQGHLPAAVRRKPPCGRRKPARRDRPRHRDLLRRDVRRRPRRRGPRPLERRLLADGGARALRRRRPRGRRARAPGEPAGGPRGAPSPPPTRGSRTSASSRRPRDRA